ncbi:hypothetical protein GCM10010521_57400 [Streptomyces rameus]|uniref:Uncharacterized protein n=1 Tax=Streptomyces rameus TaxID=68261 RepID=A0ABN3UYP0_9ACTN
MGLRWLGLPVREGAGVRAPAALGLLVCEEAGVRAPAGLGLLVREPGKVAPAGARARASASARTAGRLRHAGQGLPRTRAAMKAPVPRGYGGVAPERGGGSACHGGALWPAGGLRRAPVAGAHHHGPCGAEASWLGALWPLGGLRQAPVSGVRRSGRCRWGGAWRVPLCF